jgi:hypothetical protein
MEKVVEGVESAKTFIPYSPATPDSKEDSSSRGKIVVIPALSYNQTTLKTKKVPPPKLPEGAIMDRIHITNGRVEKRTPTGQWVPIDDLSTLQYHTQYRTVGDSSASILHDGYPEGSRSLVKPNSIFWLEPPEKETWWNKTKKFFKRGLKGRHENDRLIRNRGGTRG